MDVSEDGRSGWLAAVALSLLGATVLALWAASDAQAQQFITDDAGVADRGACEVEVWAGEEEGWILPACRPAGTVEFTVGAAVDDLGGDREPMAVAEAKTLFHEGTSWSSGVVVGAMVPTNSDLARPAEVFAYLPVTAQLEGIPAVAHLNLGWARTREGLRADPQSDDHLMWAAKLGVEAMSRFEVIGEVFGFGTDEAEGQAGIRTHRVPGRFSADLSYGHHFDSEADGLGFQLGLHWTPRPWFPWTGPPRHGEGLPIPGRRRRVKPHDFR